jgi:hypothetical protein
MGHYFMRGQPIFFPEIREAHSEKLRAFGIYRGIVFLLPVAAVPMVASCAMVPVACRPGPSRSRPAPVAIVPVIAAAAAINPITVDPDIAITRRYRAGIYNVRGLVADIAVDCTAGCGETAHYSDD